MSWLVHRACQRCGRRFSVKVGPMEPLIPDLCEDCEKFASHSGTLEAC